MLFYYYILVLVGGLLTQASATKDSSSDGTSPSADREKRDLRSPTGSQAQHSFSGTSLHEYLKLGSDWKFNAAEPYYWSLMAEADDDVVTKAKMPDNVEPPRFSPDKHARVIMEKVFLDTLLCKNKDTHNVFIVSCETIRVVLVDFKHLGRIFSFSPSTICFLGGDNPVVSSV